MKKSLLALIAVIAAFAGYAQSFEYESITYTVLSESDKTCELTNGTSSSGDVTIPASVPYNGEDYAVVSIWNGAFSYCRSLTTIKIPADVTIIGNEVFYGCSSLIEINVSENNQYYSSIGGVLFTKDKKTLLCCPGGKEGVYAVPEGVTSIGDQAFYNCTSLTEVYISESVATIGNSAFSYCKSLTTISLPDGVSTIGNSAFAHCYSLTSISLPSGVTSIGNSALNDCRSLVSVILPEGLTTIGDYAFGSCSSMTEINIPEGVTSIGNETFYGCSSLTLIDVADNNLYYTSIDGVLFSKDKETLICCPGGKEGIYIVPEGVSTIGDSSFRDCGLLTEITISEGVVTIGERAFANCYSLTSISLPSGVTSIGEQAFAHCSSLTSISLPAGVPTIGFSAFNYCESLTSINIPEGVATIGDYAFYYCTSLTSITIPEGVTTIGRRAFNYCSSLTSIDVADNNLYYTSIDGVLFTKDIDTLICFPGGKEGAYIVPEGVITIENRAFDSCSSLTSIILPAGVTTIGEMAFYDCSSLTSIALPEGVTSIGFSAFSYCESLTFVNSYSINPPVCYSNVVFYIIPNDAVLHVPVGSKDAYAAAVGWSVFANIVDDLVVENGIKEIEADRVVNEDEAEIYNLQGRRMNVSGIDGLSAGIYIVGGRKVLVK